jgi:hypothetical protein
MKNIPCISSSLWWAHETVTPDASRIDVFNSGICIRLNGEIPVGGHVDPSLSAGESLLWKKAQKRAIST